MARLVLRGPHMTQSQALLSGGEKMLARTFYIRISHMIGAIMLVLGAGGQPALAQQPAPGEVLAGLERFYEQELAFGTCDGFATTPLDELLYVDPFQCGRLEVPMDYDDLDGKTMQIGVLRLPAQGEPDERLGSLVINPGGPGGSGMQVAVLAVLTGLSDSPI